MNGKNSRRIFTGRLPLCSAAAFLVMLPLLWAALLLPEPWSVFGTAVAQLLGLAALIPAARLLLLPPCPQEAQPVALPAGTLLTGDMQVKCIMAPEVRMEPAGVRVGSSMLVCLHAAALVPAPDERRDAAVLRGLQLMKADARQMALRMPLLGREEAHGLTWQLHRDGRSLRGFACGTPEEILPICRQMVSRRPLPLTDSLREELLEQMKAERLTPLCYAMAEATDEGLGEPVYLGAFLFEEELSPDASQEIAELRRLGLRPFALQEEQPELAAAVNRRLGCDAFSLRDSFLFDAAEDDRLSRVLRRRDGLSGRVNLFVIQSALLLELTDLTCLLAGLSPFCVAAAGLLPPLWFPLCFPAGEQPARQLRPGGMLRFLVCCVTAALCMAGGSLFAEHCAVNGTPVALAVLLPWLSRCAWELCGQTGGRPLWHRRTACLATALVLLALCVGAGIGLTALGFGLALGGFGAVLGYLLTGGGRKKRFGGE